MTKSTILSLDAVAQRYGQRPSSLAGVGDADGTAYLFDLWVASIASKEEKKK